MSKLEFDIYHHARECGKQIEGLCKEIEAIGSHAENLATACAWAVRALPNDSPISSKIVKVLTDYSNRNT
jgi:hypothetical protein